jgi:hypothetical protein
VYRVIVWLSTILSNSRSLSDSVCFVVDWHNVSVSLFLMTKMYSNISEKTLKESCLSLSGSENDNYWWY